jgi:hypothetical protein
MPEVVHIGFHKTGTTTLRRDLFPSLPGVVLVTRKGKHGPPGYDQFAKSFCRAEDADFPMEELRALFADITPEPPGTLLIADELLTGILWLGTRGRDRAAERLHSLLPRARILVTVRRQDTMIRSIYSHYLHCGGHAGFPDFVGEGVEGFRFDPDYLRYDGVVERFQQLFGADRVKVMCYEHLLADPDRFTAQVCSFVLPGQPPPENRRLATENRSLAPPSRWVLRQSNALFRRSLFNSRPRLGNRAIEHLVRRLLRRLDPALFPRMSRQLGPGDRYVLHGLLPFYEDSNAKLEELSGLDLATLGYPLPAHRLGDRRQ